MKMMDHYAEDVNLMANQNAEKQSAVHRKGVMEMLFISRKLNQLRRNTMPEYTYKDVIIDPASDEARNCIGKMVYYADSPTQCLKYANYRYNGAPCSILQEITTCTSYPFITKNSAGGCIIPKKEEPNTEYISFEDKEEFLNHYAYHNDKLTESSLAYQISSFGGIFLKDKDSDDYFMVTEISKYGVVIGNNHLATTWEDILGGYLFLDGTPCGKIKE